MWMLKNNDHQNLGISFFKLHANQKENKNARIFPHPKRFSALVSSTQVYAFCVKKNTLPTNLTLY